MLLDLVGFSIALFKALLVLMVVSQDEIALFLKREPFGKRVQLAEKLPAHLLVVHGKPLAVSRKLGEVLVAQADHDREDHARSGTRRIVVFVLNRRIQTGACGFLNALEHREQPSQHVGSVGTLFVQSHGDLLLASVAVFYQVCLDDGCSTARHLARAPLLVILCCSHAQDRLLEKSLRVALVPQNGAKERTAKQRCGSRLLRIRILGFNQ